ncbi:MAG: CAP domain-containing protein [Defluviitaleaceae bacterium]|nr:CAP domain-containing protein [Defluviitaleaceae bacterium]
MKRLLAFAAFAVFVWFFTPQPAYAAAFDGNSFAQRFLELVNGHRADNGLSELVMDSALSAVSDAHLMDVVAGGFVSNTGSDGRGHLERISGSGLDLAHVSATTARFSGVSPEEVFASWANNPGISDQLLREFPTIAGISAGLGDDGNIYVVFKAGGHNIPCRNKFVLQVFRLINIERMRAGLNPLIWDGDFAAMAQTRIENLRGGGTLAHRMSDNTNPVSPEFVVASWLELEQMKERFMDEYATYIGIGYAIFAPNADNENYHTHMMVFIGSPDAIPQSADPFHPENLLDRGYSAQEVQNIIEQEIIRLTNIFRAEHGLEPLLFNQQIANFARYRAGEYMEFGYISSHISPITGNLPRYDAPDHGIDGLVFENWAGGNMSPSSTINQWINLPVHRAQMLNTANRYIGVGVVWDLEGDVPEPKQTPYGEARFFPIQWSQMFGR